MSTISKEYTALILWFCRPQDIEEIATNITGGASARSTSICQHIITNTRSASQKDSGHVDQCSSAIMEGVEYGNVPCNRRALKTPPRSLFTRKAFPREIAIGNQANSPIRTRLEKYLLIKQIRRSTGHDWRNIYLGSLGAQMISS